jgi:uncharacterized protein (DUF362 family)
MIDESVKIPTPESSVGLQQRVAVAFGAKSGYPSQSPFHPDQRYPEYPFEVIGAEPNASYEAVRETFYLLGLDGEHYGTPEWNPLGDVVKPGECVLLKPNFVKEHRIDKPGEWQQIITHGSVLRAVADYVFLALKGSGRIVIADGPQSDSDFDRISELVGLAGIRQFYAGFGIEFEYYDLRNEHWVERDGVYVGREKLRGDPAGTVVVNLGGRSHLPDAGEGRRYYGAFYDLEETNRHHCGGRHEYVFCRTPLMADVVIHVPKLKTHKKCGITLNLKGLVGLNGNKNWLPHYVMGTPKNGGDQFADDSPGHAMENALVVRAKELLLGKSGWAKALARRLKGPAYGLFGKTNTVVRSGNWWGNDTVWRMSLDLAAVLMFADKDGNLHDVPQRRFFSVVDAIIAGDGNGPMEADAKDCGMVIAGACPVSVDAVAARVMGFDYRKLALIAEAFRCEKWPFVQHGYEDIEVQSNDPRVDSVMLTDAGVDIFRFRPHFGWTGEIELRRD